MPKRNKRAQSKRVRAERFDRRSVGDFWDKISMYDKWLMILDYNAVARIVDGKLISIATLPFLKLRDMTITTGLRKVYWNLRAGKFDKLWK